MTKNPFSAQSHLWAIGAIIVIAILLGGGGSKYGMANLVVVLGALVALAFHQRAFLAFWKEAPLALRALTGLSLLLPALYILPLPPALWQALPGRDLVAQSLELIGGEGTAEGWRSASVDPVRTLLAMTALITPLALLTIGWNAPRRQLITAGWLVVALGVANFLIGIPQVLSNSEVGVLYPENPMPGVLFGTFANRNSAGIFLVAALALAALLPAPANFGRGAPVIRVAACALLVLAIILTRSRTALVLAAVPLGLFALRVVTARLARSQRSAASAGSRAWMVLAPVALALVAVGAVTFAAPGRVADVVERFDTDRTDARAYIWEDAAYSVDRYWPVGAGTGTFDDVFQIDESLENMTRKKAGRAHNDYLEVAIETGLPGLVLVAGWLLLLLWLSWRARTARDRWIAWGGAAILAVFALQSITDYPLRNQSLLAIGGFALVLLSRFSSDEREATQ